MLHVVVTIYSGKISAPEVRSGRRPSSIAQAVMSSRGMEKSRSRSARRPKDWTAKVYKLNIIGKSHTIYKKPGCHPQRTERQNDHTQRRAHLRQRRRLGHS